MTAHVDGTLMLVSVEGVLTLGTDPHFARRVHELAALSDTDAAVVDFRQCGVLFGASEAAEALAPVYAVGEIMPRPIAMICLQEDFERFNEFASRAGHSRAVRRAFTELDAAITWTAHKGRVWRARQIELRRESQGSTS